MTDAALDLSVAVGQVGRIRPATTTKPDLVPNEARPECASEQTRFDAEQRIGIPHAALDGLAQRHRTRPPRPTTWACTERLTPLCTQLSLLSH